MSVDLFTDKDAWKSLDNLEKIYMFKNNPEEFISKVVKLINEQKATMIVEHISYTESSEEPYDSTIFTAEKTSQSFDKAFRAERAIQDYVFTDGTAEQSIERKFVQKLDTADEVCVYAKLPKGFHIPTPVGNYSPDWAIAFHEGTVKHIFFIAETKGTMENVMVIAVITPDEAMKELDRDLEKTCEIMGLLYHNYGIELSDNEFDKIFDIVNR